MKHPLKITLKIEHRQEPEYHHYKITTPHNQTTIQNYLPYYIDRLYQLPLEITQMLQHDIYYTKIPKPIRSSYGHRI